MPPNRPRPTRSTLGIYTEDANLAASFSKRLSASDSRTAIQSTPEKLLSGATDPSSHAVIILDIGNGALLTDPRFKVLGEKLAGAALVVVSEALEADKVRQVIKLRAVDWLQRPLQDQDISAALLQIAGGGALARVTTVIGASGGVGATTVALMAGRYLSHSGPVALVDLDFQTGSCAAYINAENAFALDDVIANPDRLDAELLDLIKVTYKQDLDIYSFERPDLFFAASAKRFTLRLLDQLTARHGQVIIDLPNLRTPWFDDVVRHSDDLLIVFETNVVGLRHAKQLLRYLEAVRGKTGISLLANKTRFKLFGNPISRGDVARLLDMQQFYTSERDSALHEDAVNRAMIPFESSPRSRFVKDMNRYFKKIF